jgi:hypothetical protein
MAHDPTSEIAEAILQYLAARPGTSDTMENISRWWIPQGLASSRTTIAPAIEKLLAEGRLSLSLRPDGTVHYRLRVASRTERVANFLTLLIVGEPSSPVQWPSAHWELGAPHFRSDTKSHTLDFSARDVRYPRLRGKVSIEISSLDTFVSWGTRLAGIRAPGMRLSRPLKLSDGGYLWDPLVLGRLCCGAEETIRVRAFLARQRLRDSDEEAPLAVPHAPMRPPGGLSNAATPDA